MSAIDPPEKKRHGCFFYGCMTLLVIFFLAAVAFFFFARYLITATNRYIETYTETNAMALPKAEVSAEDLKALKSRVAAFYIAMDAHSNTPPLVLSGRDINALLASNTNFKDLKDMVYVDIADDKIQGEVSLPVGKYFRIPFVHTKGRYLNGTGTFTLSVTNEMLSVHVESVKVKGKPLPEEFMKPLRASDMAEDFKNGTNVNQSEGYESVEVKDGKVTLKAKEK